MRVAAAAAVIKGRKTYTAALVRQRGTAAATIRERRITIQLSAIVAAAAAAAAPKSQGRSHLLRSTAAERAEIDDRDAASQEMRRNCANVATCMHAELVTASAHAHDLES